MARKPALVAALLLCSLVVVSAALAGGNGGIAPPDSVTDSGSAINRLYWIIFGICALIFLLVEGALVWFLFRFRRRPGTPYEQEGPQLHGNTRLELLWTAVPVVILIVVATITFISVPAVNASSDDDEPLVVKVSGHQFYWQYEYPNGAITLDTLRIPVDRLVRLELTSPDVQHSWWVPEITGKRDAVPGRVNTLDFEVNRTGSFRGQCAEFCGIIHSAMVTVVDVVPGAEYDEWVARTAASQQGTGGESTLGKETYDAVCAKCHGFDGAGDIGPSVVGKIRSRESLLTLLHEGQNQSSLQGFMPPVGLGWPDRQVDALYEYLTTDPTLAGGAAGGG
jgi:cytochrome c oxidase subunit 2